MKSFFTVCGTSIPDAICGQRLFGVGTVTVLSSDRTTPTLVLKNVKNPLFVKELIHKQVEEMKLKRRVRYGEIATVGDNDDDDDLDDR